MFSSRVSVEPQYGQRKPALQLDELRRGRLARRRRREAGGAELLAARGGDPVGRPRVVGDHLDVRLGAERGDLRLQRARITSSAGQPRNVGVNSTWTRSPSTSTSRTTPRSTSEMTGISGSWISSSAAQTCVGRHHGAPAGPSGAPSSSRPRAPPARRVCVPRSTASTSASPTRAARSGRSSASSNADRVRPQLVDRLAEARLVAQPLGPHLGVHAVVGLLAVDLRGQARDRRVGVALQRLDPQRSAAS